MARVQVITGVERRRRWSEDQKRTLVAAAFAPGAVVSEVARRADVCPGQIYRWRQNLRVSRSGFAEVIVSQIGASNADAVVPMVEVAFGVGGQARIPLSTPPDLAAAVVEALVRR
jgi:transposase